MRRSPCVLTHLNGNSVSTDEAVGWGGGAVTGSRVRAQPLGCGGGYGD